MDRYQIAVWGLFLLISQSGFSAAKYDEWVYRDGSVERAEYFCGSPQSQVTTPQFKSSEGTETAIQNVLTYTIIIGPDAPLKTIGQTHIVGTFWQLDNEKIASEDADVSAYVYFECAGQKYFAFNVFTKGNLKPIMRVGVPLDDTSIFKSAQAASDDLAGFLIDASGFQKAMAKVNPTSVPEFADIPLPKARPEPATNKTPSKSETNAQVQFLTASVPLPQPRPTNMFSPAPTASTTPAPAGQTKADTDMASYDKGAVWHGHTSASLAWTTTAISVIRTNWSELSKAQDVGQFCPGYASANRKQQEICWLRIVGGIVQFESSFHPGDKMRESNGTWSVGLMAMSVGQCPAIATSIAALQQASANLKCGITDFAKWTGQASSISSRQGAARNWSTLRTPYRVYLAGRSVLIGKKKQIQSIAMVYKRYP